MIPAPEGMFESLQLAGWEPEPDQPGLCRKAAAACQLELSGQEAGRLR